MVNIFANLKTVHEPKVGDMVQINLASGEKFFLATCIAVQPNGTSVFLFNKDIAYAEWKGVKEALIVFELRMEEDGRLLNVFPETRSVFRLLTAEEYHKYNPKPLSIGPVSVDWWLAPDKHGTLRKVDGDAGLNIVANNVPAEERLAVRPVFELSTVKRDHVYKMPLPADDSEDDSSSEKAAKTPLSVWDKPNLSPITTDEAEILIEFMDNCIGYEAESFNYDSWDYMNSLSTIYFKLREYSCSR